MSNNKEGRDDLPSLYIIRGLPGSGKTTFAENLCDQGLVSWHYEADQFFWNKAKGVYEFDPTKLSEAHEWCFGRVKKMVENGDSVAVSNTFSRRWEFQKYLELPARHFVLTMNGNFKSVHDVPETVIAKMRLRWED